MGPMRRVPLCDLTRQVEALKPELMAAVERVLSSGHYILGPEVEAFEQEAVGYLGARHAIGVANGTDALWLALKAIGIGHADRVLTTPFTFFATASAILNSGAEPVFADIEPKTFNLDPERVRQVLERRSPEHERLGIDARAIKAIIAVHLYGQSADMEVLMALAQEHKLFVVEDAAQALGAEYRGYKVGTIGHLGCFSFFPTKNLGAFGDGGLVVTNNDTLAQKVRLLRAHGARPKYHHHLIGTNSRLDALQAALLRVKLQYLDAWIAARQAHAAAYDQALCKRLNGLEPPCRAPGRMHTYHQYTVRVQGGHRDALQKFLGERDVESIVYYPLPLHLQPALRYLGYREGDYPEAEQVSREVLSLPMSPELMQVEMTYVAETCQDFFRNLD
jgi:dTDP-4-amino-4,6-dideoxygalactose transaminase